MRNFSLLAGTALAVAALSTGAQAASKNDTLTVKITVNPIIFMLVTDSTMFVEASDLADNTLDTTELTNTAGRATFAVWSNTGIDITLAPAATWEDAVGVKEVKFVGQSTGAYIGGEIFLDTDISVDQPAGVSTDIVAWNPTTGNVTKNYTTRGVRSFGVGAIFEPQTWRTSLDVQEAANSIAPPDAYQTVVTVTASSN